MMDMKSFRAALRIMFVALVLQIISVGVSTPLAAESQAGAGSDGLAGRFQFAARASLIDPAAREHPEIDFRFEKDGKPVDLQHASVDVSVKSRGRLVIWLMGHSGPLFERINSYGLHAIRVHYANGWFNRFGKEPPPEDEKFLGRIRLEAATGEDFSPVVSIPKADSIEGRSLVFLNWLVRENPAGNWDQFLTEDRKGVRWEKVILAGSSHGSTTAARFAKHRKVDRVVMFCGPRDQYENWQGLPSATPANCFFGFSHVLDTGWSGDHYCRSWELLGLNQFGPVTEVDGALPPYGNSRRLITRADVNQDVRRAHGCVVPGSGAVKDAQGRFVHEEVWRYLFTHPVESIGKPVAVDPECAKDLRKPEWKRDGTPR